MKKDTKKKLIIVFSTIALYLIYLFTDIPRMDFIPFALLLCMFLALATLKYKPTKL